MLPQNMSTRAVQSDQLIIFLLASLFILAGDKGWLGRRGAERRKNFTSHPIGNRADRIVA